MEDRANGAAAPAGDLPYRWVGNLLCVDFANTVAWTAGVHPPEREAPRPKYERFTRYERILDWSREAGTLDGREASVLRAEAGRRPAEAERALEWTRTVRLALHRVLAAAVHERRPDPAAMAVLNAALTEAHTRMRLVSTDGHFSWEWIGGDVALDRPLWPVVLSAADLLTGGDRARLRECAADQCGFLFLDVSRPGNRRWCDMSDCGNRAKARRHYERARSGRSTE